MDSRIYDKLPVRFGIRLANLYFENRVGRAAAALTFFLLLTVFPLVICINAFLGLVDVNWDAILQTLQGVLPAGVFSLVSSYVQYLSENQSTPMFVAGLLTVLLSASAAVRTMLDVMDEIHGQVPQGAAASLKRLGLSFAVSLLFLVTMYLSIIVVLTGGWFFRLIEQALPRQLLALIDLDALAGLWTWMRYILLFLVVMALVLILYRAGTPVSTGVPILTGALTATIAMVAASAIFSLIIGLSSRYSLLYGSLASVIILMLWLYLCSNILIIGCAVNQTWYEIRPETSWATRSERRASKRHSRKAGQP